VKRVVVWLLLALPALAIAQPSGEPPASEPSAEPPVTAPTTPAALPAAPPVAPPVARPPPPPTSPAAPPVAPQVTVPAPAPAPAPALAPPATPKIDHRPQVANHATQPAVPKKGEKAEPTENKTKVSSLFAIKVIGGLAALLVLAYLGGNRRVVRFQEQLGISGVITAGFPFVALGALASLPQIGILNHDVLAKLRPVLHFGLGWVGFIIGAQLDIRVLDRVPKGTAYLILVEALGPFGITAAGCGILMVSFGMSLDDPATWRDMILLGTAAAMTAPRKFRGFANRTWHEGRGVDVLLGQLDELVGVIGLLFITAYFRDDVGSTTWQLPSTAWVFVSLGLGVAIGVLIFAMIRVPVSNVEFLAVVLGAIAFASGLAGNLRLSPIVICFIAGVLVTNFPNEQRESVFRILNHLERPVHLLFLMIAGAVWTITDWRGWALVPLFVAGRIIGKWTGIFASKNVVGALLPTAFADQRTLVTPLSGLSIALVISVQSLYHDEGLPWIMTAVIGGAVVAELLVARTPDPVRARTAPVVPIDELEDSGPIDELDDADDDQEGPIYRDEPPARPSGGK
jgi:Kef-type K+ transport system membrane component KefB